MQILTARDKFLSNYEVLQHLRETLAKYNWTFTPEDEAKSKNKHKKRFTACGLELEAVTRDLLSYLGKTPSAAVGSESDFAALMKHLNTLSLMKVEKLQIVNLLPRSMVHLYALVEECDQRFDEDTCTGIIEKIGELFPVEEEEAEEEGAEEVEEVEEVEDQAMDA